LSSSTGHAWLLVTSCGRGGAGGYEQIKIASVDRLRAQLPVALAALNQA
jgi:hypothetical protein